MSCRSWIAAGFLAAGLLLSPMVAVTSAGGGLFHRVRSTQATPHTERQAGYPSEVSPMSMVSYNEHYSGYYVGGGKPFSGNGACGHVGTWGWDYTPFSHIMPTSRIILGWSGHYQGGTGSYRTDGPKPLEHIKESVHGHFSGGE